MRQYLDVQIGLPHDAEIRQRRLPRSVRYSETETHQLIEDAAPYQGSARPSGNRPASRLHVARTTPRRSGKALVTAEAQATRDELAPEPAIR
jgi:cob(I)alamin adenosyltransferase